MHPRGRTVAVGAATVIVCAATPAIAGRAAPRVTLNAPDAAGCPTEHELVGKVEGRLLETSVVDPAQTFEVKVEGAESGLRAHLMVEDGHGALSERVVEGASCVDVLETVAFIVAMTIDPETATRAPPDEPRSESSAAPDPPPIGLAPAPPAATVASPLSTEPLDSPTRDRAPDETSKPLDIGFELGALAEGTTAVAPGVTPVVRVFGAVRWKSVGVVYPSVRLSGARGTRREAAVDDSRGGELQWTAGRIEACGSSSLRSSRLLAEICPALDLGVLQGSGYGVEPPHTENTTWVSVDLLGRLGFFPTKNLALEAEGGLVVPVTRDRFYVNGPEAEVFEVPGAAVTFGGGLALALP